MNCLLSEHQLRFSVTKAGLVEAIMASRLSNIPGMPTRLLSTAKQGPFVLHIPLHKPLLLREAELNSQEKRSSICRIFQLFSRKIFA